MSDPNLRIQQQIKGLDDTLERLRKADTPPLYLPFAQRVLNPFPLASSGGIWGDMGHPWAVNILAFYASVYVATTNNGSHYWVLTINDAASSILASVDTSAASANTFTRLSDTSITQPSASNAVISLFATAVGSPGAIWIAPSVSLLRTGN